MEDLIIIIALILLNGVFSMSEVALISARKSRLSADAKAGSRNAATALGLANEPDRFLSTVQVGITLIGILTGLFSGAAIASELAGYLEAAGMKSATALTVAKVIIVSAVTYLSIVVGELVPKRLALARADSIARLVAGPMKLLSVIACPVVWLLSKSTSAIVALMRLGQNSSKVTEEEIRSLIQEGTESGEVKEVEQDIMERVLVLGDYRIGAIMTARKDVACLTVAMNEECVRKVLSEELHSTYPVFDNEKEEICGVISLKKLILALGSPGFSIERLLAPGLALPETMSVYDALDTFKRTREHSALVYDEYGCFQGILTVGDILDGLVGTMPGEAEEPMIVCRNDTDEWLVDGQCPMYDFLAFFDREDLYSPSSYTTVGGLIIDTLKRVPATGDSIEWNCFHIEVVDMDLARIDKVAVRISTPGE